MDIVIGPIEVYDDKLFAYKASHEGIVLIKDREWSGRLTRYAEFLPRLQAGLPVPEAYRSERPGLEADLNVYDAIYHAGLANARPTASAINLPNDEAVALAKGTRRLQLKNVMRAKFDTIVRPIAELLLADDQRRVPHIRRLVRDGHVPRGRAWPRDPSNGRRSWHGRECPARAGNAARRTEGRRRWPVHAGSLAGLRVSGIAPLIGQQVAHLADMFRLLRYGGASPYALSAGSQLNFLMSSGAVSRDAVSGTYRIDPDGMGPAVEEMTARLLMLQGDGDYAGAVSWYESTGTLNEVLRSDIDRLARQGVAIDVIYEQGVEVLGLA